MMSLKQICLDKISEQTLRSPEVIREMILGETRRKFIERIQQQELQKYTILQDIVPDILRYMDKHYDYSSLRDDFRESYPFVSSDILNLAINIAERTYGENRY